jgi:hypothetical protein
MQQLLAERKIVGAVLLPGLPHSAMYAIHFSKRNHGCGGLDIGRIRRRTGCSIDLILTQIHNPYVVV